SRLGPRPAPPAATCHAPRRSCREDVARAAAGGARGLRARGRARRLELGPRRLHGLRRRGPQGRPHSEERLPPGLDAREEGRDQRPPDAGRLLGWRGRLRTLPGRPGPPLPHAAHEAGVPGGQGGRQSHVRHRPRQVQGRGGLRRNRQQRGQSPAEEEARGGRPHRSCEDRGEQILEGPLRLRALGHGQHRPVDWPGHHVVPWPGRLVRPRPQEGGARRDLVRGRLGQAVAEEVRGDEAPGLGFRRTGREGVRHWQAERQVPDPAQAQRQRQGHRHLRPFRPAQVTRPRARAAEANVPSSESGAMNRRRTHCIRCGRWQIGGTAVFVRVHAPLPQPSRELGAVVAAAARLPDARRKKSPRGSGLHLHLWGGHDVSLHGVAGLSGGRRLLGDPMPQE
ncbi:unnamed protein product, partial [Prorocentrum cordatum]